MKKKKKNKYDGIREDLMLQLERNGVVGKHYEDLIEDYVKLAEIKDELTVDIKERGVTVMYQNGKEQWGHKKNDSIAEVVKVSAQMLKILSELNLKPPKPSGGEQLSEEDYL